MKTFPSRTEITTAMSNPHVCYKATELIDGNVIKTSSRVIQYSGGYTNVFPFVNKEKHKVAVRLWIADIGDAKMRTSEISSYLKGVNSNYFEEFHYVDDAVLISGQLHPVVIMTWVDGDTLKEYIDKNINNKSVLYSLADKFKRMVEHFHDLNIAHGDLQHGNIMVRSDGSLAVIDYDSMYIKPLDGLPDIIKGLEGYQHPARLSNKMVHSKLDYFSELVIYLSLLVFAKYPSLWDQVRDTEDLLFEKDDFLNPSQSQIIQKLKSSGDEEIVDLTDKMLEELAKDDLMRLLPLEELLVDRKAMAREEIIDKWDKQPNPPKPKEFTKPDSRSISDKF